jgi:hypothetical protein
MDEKNARHFLPTSFFYTSPLQMSFELPGSTLLYHSRLDQGNTWVQGKKYQTDAQGFVLGSGTGESCKARAEVEQADIQREGGNGDNLQKRGDSSTPERFQRNSGVWLFRSQHQSVLGLVVPLVPSWYKLSLQHFQQILLYFLAGIEWVPSFVA